MTHYEKGRSAMAEFTLGTRVSLLGWFLRRGEARDPRPGHPDGHASGYRTPALESRRPARARRAGRSDRRRDQAALQPRRVRAARAGRGGRSGGGGWTTAAVTARLGQSRATATSAAWGSEDQLLAWGSAWAWVTGRRSSSSHAVPLGETEVERHESVHAADGEIGRVEGFVVDPADHKVTHVLLQEGHLWGRKEVAIPISAVSSVDAGIRLNITKKQVEESATPRTGSPVMGGPPDMIAAHCDS